jgi:hypothetical protein
MEYELMSTRRSCVEDRGHTVLSARLHGVTSRKTVLPKDNEEFRISQNIWEHRLSVELEKEPGKLSQYSDWITEGSGLDSLYGQEIFLLSTTSTPALKPTRPHNRMCQWPFPWGWGVKVGAAWSWPSHSQPVTSLKIMDLNLHCPYVFLLWWLLSY